MKAVKYIAWAAGGALGLILVLYFLPFAVDIDDRKPLIEGKIEEIMKFDITIDGNMTFAIIPQPSIILRNVSLRKPSGAADEKPFMKADRLYVSIDFPALIKGNIKIGNAIASRGSFDYAIYAGEGSEAVSELLSGRQFEALAVRDFSVLMDGKEGGRRLDRVDMNLKSFNNAGISGNGSFRYGENRVDDMTFLLSFIDTDNFNLNLDMMYENGDNSIETKLDIVMKGGKAALSGSASLSMEDAVEFSQSIDEDLRLPDIPFLRGRLKARANIQTAEGAVILSNGVLDAGDTFANWSAAIPIRRGGDGGADEVSGTAEVKLDFKTMAAPKFVDFGGGFVADPAGTARLNANLLRLLSMASVKLACKNAMLENGLATDLILETSPEPDGVKIANLSFMLGRDSFKASGMIIGEGEGQKTTLDIARTPPFSIRNDLFKATRITSLAGRVEMAEDYFIASGLDIDMGGEHIAGTISKARGADGRNEYNLDLKSDRISADKITDKPVDMRYIISRLALLKGARVKANAQFRQLALGPDRYDQFRLDAIYDEDDLNVRKLSFKNGGVNFDISGGLIDLSGESGRFDNFNYVVSADSPQGMTIPLIKNKFVERVIANKVNKVNIRLTGPADNPEADVSARLPNVSVSVSGSLMKDAEEYGVNFSHNELKGFLFSWGYIDESLVDYFYDEVPFSVKATSDAGNLRNLDLSIKNNRLAGEILRRPNGRGRGQHETTINLSTDRLDIRSIFKRLSTEGYVDMLLKIMRTMPYNIRLKAKEVVDYDGSIYKDALLELSNSGNPGSIKFAMAKGERALALESEILNNRIFSGLLSVKGYDLPADLMDNERMNLMGGRMDAEIKFRTDGMNMYQLLSNLAGDFTASIAGGIIDGMAGYDGLLADIVGLANISTNSVVFVIDDGFKGGRMEFDRISLSGRVAGGATSGARFDLEAPNISAEGTFDFSIIKKSLAIDSVFEISGLSPDAFRVAYKLSGFINNLDGSVDTTALIAKINTSYLQKKKRDIQASDSPPPSPILRK